MSSSSWATITQWTHIISCLKHILTLIQPHVKALPFTSSIWCNSKVTVVCMQAQVYKQQLTDNKMYFPLKQITLIKLYVKQHKSEAVKISTD